MKRTLKVLLFTLHKNKIAILLFVGISVFNGTLCSLYNIVTEAFVYSEAIISVILFVLLLIDFVLQFRKAKKRENLKKSIIDSDYDSEGEGNLEQRDYGEIIAVLQEEIRRLKTEFSENRQADDDYYSSWVHQIKTPIAVMKLQLSEDTEENRALLSELFRIEQYVEMVLDYMRLKSDYNDLVIQEYRLDEIIRDTVRKFAPQFVLRKLKFSYEPTDITAVTDKKWLSFILEQLISNAVKYTQTGEVRVSIDGNKISVSDTGIGIAPEDLPKIFEKGYTGLNGRLDRKSTGLGLFLTKKAARLLNADIKCESTVGKGSTFTVCLPDIIK